jgi:hypothetical protein
VANEAFVWSTSRFSGAGKWLAAKEAGARSLGLEQVVSRGGEGAEGRNVASKL